MSCCATFDKKYWLGKHKLFVSTSIRNCVDVSDTAVKKICLTTIMLESKPVGVSNPYHDGKEIPSSQEETPVFNSLINNSLFRRDMKILGQIGEASQKDKISFISLIWQVFKAKAKGYNENDNTSAIIRALPPGLSVRKYLETIVDLKLPRLLQILRSHFRKKVCHRTLLGAQHHDSRARRRWKPVSNDNIKS